MEMLPKKILTSIEEYYSLVPCCHQLFIVKVSSFRKLHKIDSVLVNSGHKRKFSHCMLND